MAAINGSDYNVDFRRKETLLDYYLSGCLSFGEILISKCPSRGIMCNSGSAEVLPAIKIARDGQ
jgi:hypothetical protein